MNMARKPPFPTIRDNPLFPLRLLERSVNVAAKRKMYIYNLHLILAPDANAQRYLRHLKK
jgi:hypothetical protein